MLKRANLINRNLVIIIIVVLFLVLFYISFSRIINDILSL